MVRRVTTVVLAAGFGFAPACSSREATPSLSSSASAGSVATQPHVLTKASLTSAEIKYGRAATHDPSVIYEPDVVIVDHGPDAIRSVGPDGLTWTIDARAPHVDELNVGKIAFVSGRCVGRVLQATREGDAVRLVLGPVELTDIFEKLDVTLNEPVDLTQGLEYPPQQFNGFVVPVDGDEAALPDWSATIPGAPPGRGSGGSPPAIGFGLIPAGLVRPQRPVSPGIPQALDLTFHTSPLNNADGIGAELKHEGAGIRVVAQVQVLVAKPTLDFHLSIQQKRVDAKVILHNVAGLRIAFDGGAGPDFAGNVNWYVPVPPPLRDLSIPLAGPVPLSVNLRQEIWVRTVFASKGSAFSAGGRYSLNTDLGFTYQGEKWSFVGPKGLTVEQSLMANMSSISITPTGLVISHTATITAGVGSWGFTTGPTMDLATSIGVAQGSSIGIVRCQGAALTMNIRGGVGWTIPKPIEEFVNVFLRLIKVKEVQGHGGIHTDWQNLFQQVAQTDSPVCKGGRP